MHEHQEQLEGWLCPNVQEYDHTSVVEAALVEREQAIHLAISMLATQADHENFLPQAKSHPCPSKRCVQGLRIGARYAAAGYLQKCSQHLRSEKLSMLTVCIKWRLRALVVVLQ